MLSRVISIPMLKASNYSHETPRKEDFHARLIRIHTIYCGLTYILWRSKIVEVIETPLKNLVKRNTMIEGVM